MIAAVHGYRLGQACEVAAVCDLTVAARSARFGEVEINYGWGPPIPVTPFAAGLKQAKEILLLGEVFDADRALQIGLVNRVVEDDGPAVWPAPQTAPPGSSPRRWRTTSG